MQSLFFIFACIMNVIFSLFFFYHFTDGALHASLHVRTYHSCLKKNVRSIVISENVDCLRCAFVQLVMLVHSFLFSSSMFIIHLFYYHCPMQRTVKMCLREVKTLIKILNTEMKPVGWRCNRELALKSLCLFSISWVATCWHEPMPWRHVYESSLM